MDYTAAAILLFCVIISTGLIALFRKIENIETKLDAIIKGGSFVVPKVTGAVVDGMHMFELVGKAIAQRVKRPKKIKNMDKAEIIPDVSNELLKQFAGILLREIEQSTFVGDVSLTEQTWVKDGKWKEKTGGSPQQWKDCMARLEAAGIVKRESGKNTRVWNQPNNYKGITSKIKKILKG